VFILLDALGGLVSNIAIIVILAVFVEMLFPNETMAKYLRLIMGLFIIVTLLTPVMNFLERDNSYDVVTWNYNFDNRQLESILKSGEDIQLQNLENASKEYQNRIEGQITALVRIIPEIGNVTTSVTLNENEKIRFGLVENVIIWASISEDYQLRKEIDPIVIDLSENNKEEDMLQIELNKIEIKIKDTISNFYGLSKDNIKVIWN
jgi:stage III sporulation protein AF